MMKLLLGGPGTMSGLLLRLGQFAFASSSIALLFTSLSFSRYTGFCSVDCDKSDSPLLPHRSSNTSSKIASLSISFLFTSMGLQVIWSFGHACLDIYALRRKRDLRNPIFLFAFVIIDWVIATFSLAAASSIAGVLALLTRDLNYCIIHKRLPCNMYQISVAMAFISWILTAMSSHVMFWILASV